MGDGAAAHACAASRDRAASVVKMPCWFAHERRDYSSRTTFHASRSASTYAEATAWLSLPEIFRRAGLGGRDRAPPLIPAARAVMLQGGIINLTKE